MRYRITSRLKSTMIVPNPRSVDGDIRIPPYESVEVDLRELPEGLKSLVEKGRATVEIVHEKRTSKGVGKGNPPPPSQDMAFPSEKDK